jgi:hypothetical protein
MRVDIPVETASAVYRDNPVTTLNETSLVQEFSKVSSMTTVF